jgi:hypothetical protein
MTNQDPRPGGSHRRVDRGSRVRVLLLSLLVVVLAAGGVVYSLHWRGESKRPSTATASGYPRISPSATPSRSPASGAAASTSAPPVTYPQSLTATPGPVTSATPTAPAATPSSASPAPSTSASAARPHSISTTTLFYPTGQLAAAQALAAQFTAIAKMSPAPDGVSTTHLTLVLAQDWTSSGK